MGSITYIPYHQLTYQVKGRYYTEPSKGYLGYSMSATTVELSLQSGDFDVLLESTGTEDSTTWNWLLVEVNQVLWDTLRLRPGKHAYPIHLKNYSNGNVTVRWFKCTESFVGEIRFYGITLRSGSAQSDKTALSPSSKLLFIGNSITCGYGNQVAIPSPPQGNPNTGFHAANENAYDSYAQVCARRLSTSADAVCYSGLGMYRNFNGDTTNTLPKLFNRVLLENPESPIWDSTKSSYQVIVINLGTNDYYLESKDIPLPEEAFVQHYILFVEKLLRWYPQAHIICTNGTMLNDGWPMGKKCFTRVQANIERVCAYFHSKNIQQVHSFKFSPQQGPFGEDYHPSKRTHEQMADSLVTFIKQQTWWK